MTAKVTFMQKKVLFYAKLAGAPLASPGFNSNEKRVEKYPR